MDNSAEYIKMCEKSEEIQSLVDLTIDGDFYYMLDKFICEFWHNRNLGLASCLAEASKTVK